MHDLSKCSLYVSTSRNKANKQLIVIMQYFVLFLDPRASPRQRPPSPARSPNDVALRQIIGEKTKLEGEILGYKQKIRTFENEISNLKEKVIQIFTLSII